MLDQQARLALLRGSASTVQTHQDFLPATHLLHVCSVSHAESAADPVIGSLLQSAWPVYDIPWLLTLQIQSKLSAVLWRKVVAVSCMCHVITVVQYINLCSSLTLVATGEGGAGTWSDGKLTTKVGRNSDPVRRVLHTLHAFGAPQVRAPPRHELFNSVNS